MLLKGCNLFHCFFFVFVFYCVLLRVNVFALIPNKLHPPSDFIAKSDDFLTLLSRLATYLATFWGFIGHFGDVFNARKHVSFLR